jgi:Ni,Fe-hydrogenase I large subunit
LATRPQADVAGSLATSGCYRQCSVVACKATDRSSMAVQWCSWSDGVRWQANRVEVGHLASGLLVMDRLGRTVRGAHRGKFTMASGQFTWRVNIPWCMAERLAETG